MPENDLLFHNGSTIKDETNQKCNVFCYVLNNIDFPMKEKLTIANSVFVRMRFRGHCYVAAP